MTRTRLLFANTLIVLLLVASAYDVIGDEEHWPFSQYPMFSRIFDSRTLSWLRMYVVTSDGQEFPLLTHAEVFPFDQSRLSKAIGAARTRPDAQTAIDAILVNCLDRYERLRLQGRHGGPRAVRMRLYEVTWTLHPTAANLGSPDERRLIGETAP